MLQQPTLPLIDDGPALVAGPVVICFEIKGEPFYKGRHRARIVYPKDGKPFIHMYPDPVTAKYEAAIAQIGRHFMAARPPVEGPLALIVHAFRKVPESWSGRQHARAYACAIVPTSRPDGDNYLKVVQDALNKIVWNDDAQIVDARVIKRYSDDPALRVEIRRLVAPGGLGMAHALPGAALPAHHEEAPGGPGVDLHGPLALDGPGSSQDTSQDQGQTSP